MNEEEEEGRPNISIVFSDYQVTELISFECALPFLAASFNSTTRDAVIEVNHQQVEAHIKDKM